jgi:pimeloyl-ACP methyl ester carboxylesterase
VDMLGVEYCNNHPMMGKLPFDASRPETLSKFQRALVRMVGAPGSNLGEKIAVMRKAVFPEGIPVRVITSGTAWLPKPEELKAWRESHERLTASIKGAVQILAEKSGHMIPYSQPDLLVAVVSEVTRLAQESRGVDPGSKGRRFESSQARPLILLALCLIAGSFFVPSL